MSQSEVFSFRTPQPTGFNSFPQKLGMATIPLLSVATEAPACTSSCRGPLRTGTLREGGIRLAPNPMNPGLCRLQV